MFRYYLHLALRRCRRSPGTVALVVLTMAIGIAACMTALTIFSALEGEPLPGISNHLYVVTMDAREHPGKANPAYDKPDSELKWRDARTLVDTRPRTPQVALAQTQVEVGNPNGHQSDVVSGLLAYGSVLRELGVPLRSGRPWTDDEQASRAPVVVIDAVLAQKLFGTEEAAGRSVEIGHHRFHVVGVTAPWKPRTQFIDAGPYQILSDDMQVFIPVGAALDAGIGPINSGECGDDTGVGVFGSVDVSRCRWLELWAALKTPAEVASYRDFVSGYASAQHRGGRFVYPPHAKLYGTRAWMALNHVVPGDVALNVLLAGAFLVLCMINVVGLLTARFLRRQADVAIRRALGASWRQVFAQHLVESGFLGLLGGTLALPLTLLGTWIVRKQPVGYATAAQFGAGMFFALLVLSLMVGMVVGVLPAWRVCRLPPAIQIKQASGDAMRYIVKPLLRRPLMPLLVVLQVALACAIACNALFLLQQKVTPLVASDGIGDPGNLVFLHGIFPRGTPWPAAQLRSLEAELRGVPGVRAVSYAATLPMVSAAQFTVDVGKGGSHAGVSTSVYFGDHLTRILGLKLVAGRDFLPEESAADIDMGSGQGGPVIVTRALADRLFKDGTAVGQTIPDTNSMVVGVVAHLMRNKFVQGGRNLDYAMLRPGVPKQWPAPMYAIRLGTPDAARACKAMLPVVKQALGARLLPGHEPQCDTYADLRGQMLAPQRAAAWLLSGVTLIVLIVTLTGIAGMTGYWVQQRTRSIGVRRALGAKRRDVLRELLLENLLVVGIGVAVGLAAAYAVNLWLMRHYELLRLPWIYLPMGALLLLVLGQLAVLAPARRASGIPPIVATRTI